MGVVTKDDANVDLYLAGRNLPGLEFNTADRLNLVEVLSADRILVEESALTAINERRLGSRRAPPDPRSAQREELNVYKRKNEIHIAWMHSRQFLEGSGAVPVARGQPPPHGALA